MPAESHGLRRVEICSAIDQRRRFARRPCSLRVLLGMPGGEVWARLTDVSEGGLGFTSDSLVMLRPGLRVLISHQQFGAISCVVRWTIPPRYGAEVTASGSALARLKTFYDTLPPAPGDIL